MQRSKLLASVSCTLAVAMLLVAAPVGARPQKANSSGLTGVWAVRTASEDWAGPGYDYWYCIIFSGARYPAESAPGQVPASSGRQSLGIRDRHERLCGRDRRCHLGAQPIYLRAPWSLVFVVAHSRSIPQAASSGPQQFAPNETTRRWLWSSIRTTGFSPILTWPLSSCRRRAWANGGRLPRQSSASTVVAACREKPRAAKHRGLGRSLTMAGERRRVFDLCGSS
jgi:hypothetical protein